MLSQQFVQTALFMLGPRSKWLTWLGLFNGAPAGFSNWCVIPLNPYQKLSWNGLQVCSFIIIMIVSAIFHRIYCAFRQCWFKWYNPEKYPMRPAMTRHHSPHHSPLGSPRGSSSQAALLGGAHPLSGNFGFGQPDQGIDEENDDGNGNPVNPPLIAGSAAGALVRSSSSLSGNGISGASNVVSGRRGSTGLGPGTHALSIPVADPHGLIPPPLIVADGGHAAHHPHAHHHSRYNDDNGLPLFPLDHYIRTLTAILIFRFISYSETTDPAAGCSFPAVIIE
jgi:hypothetical protein